MSASVLSPEKANRANDEDLDGPAIKHWVFRGDLRAICGAAVIGLPAPSTARMCKTCARLYGSDPHGN